MTSTTSAYPLPTFTIVDGPHWHDHDTDGRAWAHRRYRVRLTYDGRSIEVPWMQGTGITHDPEAHDVLGALLMEAQGIEASTGFPDWCEQYGYDPDESARALYDQCCQQSDALADLLTRPLMLALMDDENATYGAAPRFALAWDTAVGRLSA